MALILMIEDQPSNMKLGRYILTAAGHEVIGASEALEGITLAAARRPDLILMDIQLPDVDGFEATRRLKMDSLTADIPVVALTAYAMRDDKAKILSAGCDGYLAKPYRRADLVEVVDRVLARRGAASNANGRQP